MRDIGGIYTSIYTRNLWFKRCINRGLALREMFGDLNFAPSRGMKNSPIRPENKWDIDDSLIHGLRVLDELVYLLCSVLVTFVASQFAPPIEIRHYLYRCRSPWRGLWHGCEKH